jgi:myo-inositol-1(or 4)-monophosphatase
LAQGAGELLSSHYGTLRRADADRKDGRRRDLVSVADREAERYLFERIPATDDVLAEEGSDRTSGGRRRWVVDPLDGTVNYLHGIPFWCVSIAIIEDNELSVAVVHAPVLAQTFTATRGGGCFLNGERVCISQATDIREAILATGFAYNRNEVPDNNVDNWATMALQAAGLRRMGSAALDLAYTACGRLDGYWELHLSPWDVAAGALLVREAGGVVSNFRGEEDVAAVIGSRHIIASNNILHELIRSRLSPLQGL